MMRIFENALKNRLLLIILLIIIIHGNEYSDEIIVGDFIWNDISLGSGETVGVKGTNVDNTFYFYVSGNRYLCEMKNGIVKAYLDERYAFTMYFKNGDVVVSEIGGSIKYAPSGSIAYEAYMVMIANMRHAVKNQ